MFLDCQSNIITHTVGSSERDQGFIPKSICDIVLSMRHSENITITTLEEGKIHLKRMMLNERTSRKRGHIFLHVSTDTKTLYVMTDVGLGSPETNRCHSLFLVTIVKCVKSQCQVPRALSKPYTKNGCQLQLLRRQSETKMSQ